MNRQKLVVALGLAAMVLALFVFGRWAWLSRKVAHDQLRVPTLVVLSYDTFSGSTGAGPEIVYLFEKVCRCKVELLTASDGGVLLEKLKRASGLAIDVVVGLDQFYLPGARQQRAWQNLTAVDMPWSEAVRDFVAPDFLPIDYAPLTLIYRRGEIFPPQSWAELSDPRFAKSVSLQNPQTSSPGLQFLFAAEHWRGTKPLAEFLLALKPSIHSISPSWAMSYGLFQKHEAKLTFSYLTSLVFHWVVQGNERYQPVIFGEGHPLQVEYAGVPSTCRECALGKEFVSFLLSPEAQRILMAKNFMFPARDGLVAGSHYSRLPHLPILPARDLANFLERKDELLSTWQRALE